ncbi:zf-HC2 domain-containing protein [Nocardia sp. CNY236]|uniref:zf-HC2 domain-containing protein n=1 Tax=Nocardia sp. CNY236 TaxID=1169152 RepID=UPI000491C8BB|nr:zf-HC2 domain-containing protein [Nocardia sp. CNY236]
MVPAAVVRCPVADPSRSGWEDDRVECSLARESLSVRLDAEVEDVAAARVDEHLARCGRCRRWNASAAEVTWQARVGAVQPVPDLFERIVAEVCSARPRRRRWVGGRGRGEVCRVLAGLVGARRG